MRCRAIAAMCCRQKSSASADSVAETSRQMCPWPPDEAAKSQSLNAVKATDGPTAVTVSACVDALCNANCAMFFGIFVGASSQINPRRVQRAHGSPDVKLQRTLDTLQALQTRAGGGMHNGLAADPGRNCRHLGHDRVSMMNVFDGPGGSRAGIDVALLLELVRPFFHAVDVYSHHHVKTAILVLDSRNEDRQAAS